MRERERLGLVMRHVYKRDSNFLLQVDELDLHFFAQLRIERCQRFVEQQHGRMRHERAAYRHALLLSTGELVWIALAESEQANVGECLLDLAGNLGRRCFSHL